MTEGVGIIDQGGDQVGKPRIVSDKEDLSCVVVDLSQAIEQLVDAGQIEARLHADGLWREHEPARRFDLGPGVARPSGIGTKHQVRPEPGCSQRHPHLPGLVHPARGQGSGRIARRLGCCGVAENAEGRHRHT